jgi:hypothetical protein
LILHYIDIYLKLRHKKCQWEDIRLKKKNKIKQFEEITFFECMV